MAQHTRVLAPVDVEVALEHDAALGDRAEALEAHHMRAARGRWLHVLGGRHPEGGRLLRGLRDFGSATVTVTGTFGHDVPHWCLGQGPR